jgi:CPA1 family monovalent cation:H+ antiporter
VPYLDPIQLVLLLFVVATALAYLARQIGIPYPILLVLGGLALGFVPALPTVELEPELVFLLFLPPILFGAGFDTPIRDFKANLRPILLLAVGLVLFTTLVVGVTVHALVPDIGWPAAFALGAIVAPPDSVAATAIFQRLGVPPRLVTILEGESLINDASALTAYRFAIAAALTGTFSVLEAGAAFVVVAVGGIAVGIVVGLLVTESWRRTADPILEIIVSLIAPATAYLAAELVGVSGVLAAVSGGLIAGRMAPRVLNSEGRLLGRGVWSVVTFLINGAVFILIGLQLRSVVADLDRPVGEAFAIALAVSAVVVVARIVWVFPATYLPRWASASLRARDPNPPPRTVFVLSWAGLRGVVSLAAALALPHGTDVVDFPERNLIIFITFVVILVTLVGQGLTLPWLTRALGVVAATGTSGEAFTARTRAIEAALARLGELEVEYRDHEPLIRELRERYEHRASHDDDHQEGLRDEAERELYEHRKIRQAVLDAERNAVIGLRDAGVIGDGTMRVLERDLDLEELRMEA